MQAKPIAVVMCDYWRPFKSANVVCVEKLIGPLSKKYDVRIITADDPHACYDSTEIAVGDIRINVALDRAAGHPVGTTLIKLANKFNVARYVSSYPIRSWEWASRYEYACRGVLESGGVELVIAVCFPGECVEAAVKLKAGFPTVRFVALFLDEVAVGMYRKEGLLRFSTSRAAVRFEREAISTLDAALFLSAAKGLVELNHPQLLDKIGFVDVPFMADDSVTYRCDIAAGKAVTILYAGTLANPDRNPVRFIDMVRSVFDQEALRLCFAGETAGLLGGVDGVERLGLLPSAACDALMEESDILLSIGNRDPHLIPSKLFKYMGLGKPIIHLKRGAKDSCLPYLARYPLALLIDESEPGVGEKVREFIVGLPEEDGLEIPLRKLFPMAYPAYTVEALEAVGSSYHPVEANRS